MAKNIVLYPTDTDITDAFWLVCDDQGSPVAETRRDSLETIAGQVEGRKVTVVLPAEWVSLHSVTQAGGAAKAIKAIPYALEELVSDDVEDLHFAVGDRQAGDVYPVAVISAQLMGAMQHRFSEVGLRPTELRAEPQALPQFNDSTNSWTALLLEDRFVARMDDYSGFAIDADNAGFMLEQSLAEAGENPPAGMVLFSADESDETPVVNDLEIELRACPDKLGLLAKGVHTTSGINLLQGDFSFKRQFDRAWKPWRSAMVLAALLVFQTEIANGFSNLQASQFVDNLSTVDRRDQKRESKGHG